MERCQSGHVQVFVLCLHQSSWCLRLFTQLVLLPKKLRFSGSPFTLAHICVCYPNNLFLNFLPNGEVSEWSNVPAWKASVSQGTAGSNPVFSARVYLIKPKKRAS